MFRLVIAIGFFTVACCAAGTDMLPPASPDTFEVSFADVNGDGLDDAIRKEFSTGNIDIWLNTNGSFTPSASLFVPGAAAPNGSHWDTWFADTNGDGLADLIDRNRSSGDLYIYLGTGSTFQSPGTIWSGNGVGGEHWYALLGDMNGDGRADLLGVNKLNGDVFVWENIATGLSSTPNVAQPRLLAGIDFENVALHFQDCDGDGRDDLLRQDLNSSLFVCVPSETTMFGESAVRAFAGTSITYEHQVHLAKITPTSPISFTRHNLRTGEILFLEGLYENSGSGPYFGHLSSARLTIGGGGRSFSQAPLPRKNERVLNVLAWYDIERSPTLGRPNNGWLPLYPGAPGPIDPSAQGALPYRSDTPILGLYSSHDPAILRQHAYWLASAGVNGIVIDWTNCPSNSNVPAPPTSLEHFCDEIRSATATLLQVWGDIYEFSPPRVTVAARISGSDYSDATLIANDIYDVFNTKQSMWFKFNDGSANAGKPFLIFFSDFGAAWSVQPQWGDARFNIRYTNGYLDSFGLLESDGLDAVRVKNGLPYWLFVEHHPSTSGSGYYRLARSRMEATPSIVEQSIAWTALYLAGPPWSWDAQNNYINGMSPVQRMGVRLFADTPRNVILGRFNYPTAWRDEPQEGVSTWESTYFEPSHFSGFSVFYDVAKIVLPLRGVRTRKPGRPYVTGLDSSGNFRFQSANDPTEYCVSPNLSCESWLPINVSEAAFQYQEGGTGLYLFTRNAFGVSPPGRMP
jgi:hypothetical protein